MAGLAPPDNNWKVTLSRDGSEKPAALAAFRAEPPMQYAGQPADQQPFEHNRAARLRSDRLRAIAAYPRGCMAAAERGEPRETMRARRTNSHLMTRSEEHTSELQSRQYLVCRLLL